jgi:hypothetical protein
MVGVWMWLFPKCPGALVKNGWSLDMAISLVSWCLGEKWLEFWMWPFPSCPGALVVKNGWSDTILAFYREC